MCSLRKRLAMVDERMCRVREGMIHDVRVKPLTVIPDERGRLMEMLRSDDQLFKKFGQLYMTTAYSDVVKA